MTRCISTAVTPKRVGIARRVASNPLLMTSGTLEEGKGRGRVRVVGTAATARVDACRSTFLHHEREMLRRGHVNQLEIDESIRPLGVDNRRNRQVGKRIGQLARLDNSTLLLGQPCTRMTPHTSTIGNVECAKDTVAFVDHRHAVATASFERRFCHEEACIVLLVVCSTHAKGARTDCFERAHTKHIDMRHGLGRLGKVRSKGVLMLARTMPRRHGEREERRLAQSHADHIGHFDRTTSLTVFAPNHTIPVMIDDVLTMRLVSLS